MTPDTDSTTTPDTSTRRLLLEHLSDVRGITDDAQRRLDAGADPGDLVGITRALRSSAQQAATAAAYARALRPTEQARRG